MLTNSELMIINGSLWLSIVIDAPQWLLMSTLDWNGKHTVFFSAGGTMCKWNYRTIAVLGYFGGLPMTKQGKVQLIRGLTVASFSPKRLLLAVGNLWKLSVHQFIYSLRPTRLGLGPDISELSTKTCHTMIQTMTKFDKFSNQNVFFFFF